MPRLEQLAAALDAVLGVHGTHGVLAPGSGQVERLALALEPWPGLAVWAADCDGIFLHRPWRARWPDGIAVLCSHEPFDAVLGFGARGRYARAALGMTRFAELGDGLGAVGDIAGPPAAAAREAFGGWESAAIPARIAESAGPRRVAVAAALRPALVEQAATLGAEVYITGSWRTGSRRALGRCGLGWIAVGHRRSELWALRTLAVELATRVPGLRCVVEPEDRPQGATAENRTSP